MLPREGGENWKGGYKIDALTFLVVHVLPCRIISHNEIKKFNGNIVALCSQDNSIIMSSRKHKGIV